MINKVVRLWWALLIVVILAVLLIWQFGFREETGRPDRMELMTRLRKARLIKGVVFEYFLQTISLGYSFQIKR